MTNPAALPRVAAPDVVSPGPLALPSLAVIDVTGADALSFLQAQLSNDLVGAGAGHACLAGYCSPKGRLLALPLVLALHDGSLRLIVPAELVGGLLQRLRMYVLRADVSFVERADLRCLGLEVEEGGVGERLAERVPGFPATPPAEPLQVLDGERDSDVLHACRWHDAHRPARHARFLLVAKGELAGREDAGGEEARWRLGDISAGVPRIALATREAFVPQMVNLQLIGALSFRKGCYPGQEIVARMQYLGKLKRHMRRFRVSGEAGEVLPGTPLVTGDGEDEAGSVVDAVATPEGIELLAVVRIAAGGEALRLGGAELEPLALPYALPEETPATAPAAAGDVDARGAPREKDA